MKSNDSTITDGKINYGDMCDKDERLPSAFEAASQNYLDHIESEYEDTDEFADEMDIGSINDFVDNSNNYDKSYCQENDNVQDEKFPSIFDAVSSHDFEYSYDEADDEDVFLKDTPNITVAEEGSRLSCNSCEIFGMFETPEEKENKKNEAKEKVNKNERKKWLKNLADSIIDNEYFIFYNSNLYVYREPIWQKITLTEFMVLARRIVGNDVALETKDFKELWNYVITDENSQLDNNSLVGSKYLINFADCVYDVRNGKTSYHCKDDYLFNYIDVDLCETPENYGYFDEFVRNASYDENDDYLGESYSQKWRQLALEILGCIISGVNPKAFFVLYGEKNTGKSQFANFCQELLGRELCTALRKPNDLAKQFKTGDLFGKKLCSAADIPDSPINAEAVAAIKSITGNDWIEGEQKYKNTFVFKNEASLLMSTNHKISIADGADDAFFDRMVCLPFRNSVPREKQIKDLSEKFMEERTYIVREALEALMNLIDNNYVFTSVDFDDNALVSSVGDADESVECFIDECCRYEANSRTSNLDIYEKYLLFCKTEGYSSKKKVSFGKIFKALIKQKYPDVVKDRSAESRGYENLKLTC